MRTPFTGCGTALVTPFTSDGALDEPAISRLARRQVEAGMHFLVPCGTTGESPTLDARERRRVVELVVEAAAARALHHRYLPLMMINFVESNPIPVKAAMARMGLLAEVFRLPMVSPSEASCRRIERVLADLELLPAAAGARA